MKLITTTAGLVVTTSVLTFGIMQWLNQPAQSVPAADAPVVNSMQSRVELVSAKGCVACHSLDGQDGIGPSWLGAWSRPVEFADGTAGVFDEAYFSESVSNPGARVRKGFQNVMIPAPLTDAEREQVMMLIMELGKPGEY